MLFNAMFQNWRRDRSRHRGTSSRPGSSRRRVAHNVLRMEPLEARCMLAGDLGAALVADIVSDQESLGPISAYRADRFATEYDDEARLRARCEEVYGRLYLQRH